MSGPEPSSGDCDGTDRDAQIGAAVFACLDGVNSNAAEDARGFVAQYPEFAVELAEFFANRERLERMAAPMRALSDAVDTAVRRDGLLTTPPGGIGDYEILAEIGRGGMGVVYKARQKALDRVVALKMLRAGDLASAADLQRFRNEAKIVANLDHPQIVPIYEVGEQEGLLYFSMKLIEGGNLATQLDRFRTDPRAAASLVAAVARAVHHAHQRGVLHRDLKPSNILLDPEGQPHVSDFGLAKHLETDSGLTCAGLLVGTPSYMAPEQAAGNQVAAVTTASDVYGLGAVFYAALTQGPPFQGETVLDTLAQVKSRLPDPPSTFNPRVKGDLETICLKCLDKEPQRRYGSADALADDLERWLAGKPIQARPVSTWGRLSRWCARNPLVAGLCVLLALLGVALVTAMGLSIVLISAERDRAREQETLAVERGRGMRRLLYPADMRLAQQAYDIGELRQAEALLARYLPVPGEEDLRTFPWFYLKRLCRKAPPPTMLAGHKGDVYHATFSPDGKTLATAGQDGTVRLWDWAAGRELRRIDVSNQDVDWVSFSPDGANLATAGDDRLVKIWDAKTGQEVATLRDHPGEVVCAEFSPDGKLLASAGHDRVIRLWDRQTWTVAKKLVIDHAKPRVNCLAFSSDSKYLVSANGLGVHESEYEIWGVQSGTTICSKTADVNWSCAQFSHHGQVLAAAGGPRVSLVNAEGAEIGELPGHQTSIESLAFSPDDWTLATGNKDGTIRLWDTGRRDLLRLLETPSARVWCVAFSTDGKTLVASGSGGNVMLWELAKFPMPFARTVAPAGGLLLSPDARKLAVQTPGGFRIWDLIDRQNELLPAIQPAAFSGDGSMFLALLKENRQPTVWHIPSRGARLGLPTESHPGYAALGLSADGRTALTQDASRFRLWDTATGQEADSLPGAGELTAAVFSEDGTLILTAIRTDKGGQIKAWDRATKHVRYTLDHKAAVRTIAIDSGKRFVATGSDDGFLKVWDAATGRQLFGFAEHGGGSLAFSRDGNCLATASGDAIRFWDLRAGHESLTLKAHGSVHTLAFTPDGHDLVSAGPCHPPHADLADVMVWRGSPEAGTDRETEKEWNEMRWPAVRDLGGTAEPKGPGAGVRAKTQARQ